MTLAKLVEIVFDNQRNPFTSLLLHVVPKSLKNVVIYFIWRRVSNWSELTEFKWMSPVPELLIMKIFIEKRIIHIVIWVLLRVYNFAAVTKFRVNVVFVVVLFVM